jgi:hypothetical protein
MEAVFRPEFLDFSGNFPAVSRENSQKNDYNSPENG